MSYLRSNVLARLPEPIANRLRAAKRSLTRHWVDEAQIVASLAPDAHGQSEAVLVDVGAHCGDVTAMFLDKGWSVVAYEPDPSNRQQFEKRIGNHPRLQLSTCAVSDKAVGSVSLFTSPTSTGISTLSAFHESHEPTATVDVVTLSDDLRARNVARVDFLKVDIEGFDFFALKGFNWGYLPRFVLYEFENRKTVPLGYSLMDSTAFLTERGYHLVYSVWEPIVEYGMRHRWRGLFDAPPSDVETCWGNVLGFRDAADAASCVKKFGPRSGRHFGRADG